ncbi:hypothetical protein Tco_1032803 [Tanacetum coccineum]|uniref:Transmembrane protein n=1 Tax=Tanacetum coccineum TaxID=301880 RepID=A0ABQ5GCV2_9ASTR
MCYSPFCFFVYVVGVLKKGLFAGLALASSPTIFFPLCLSFAAGLALASSRILWWTRMVIPTRDLAVVILALNFCIVCRLLEK